MPGRRVNYRRLDARTKQVGVEKGYGASFCAALLRAGIKLQSVERPTNCLTSDEWFEVVETFDEVKLRNAIPEMAIPQRMKGRRPPR